MKETFKVIFIDSNNCFFYLNDGCLARFATDGQDDCCIKIEFGPNFNKCTYSSLNSRFRGVSDDNIGINAIYAEKLGLDEDDEVLVSKSNAPSLSHVYVRPTDDSQFELIKKNKNFFECSLLDQVRILAVNQTIPIFLYSNVTVFLEVEKLVPNISFGQIVHRTEVIVEHPSDLPSMDESTGTKSSYNTDFENNALPNIFADGQDKSLLTRVKNYVMGLFKHFRKSLYNVKENGTAGHKVQEEGLLRIYHHDELKHFIAGPTFAYQSKVPGHLRNSCFFAENILANKLNVVNPSSVQSICRITSKLDDLNESFKMFNIEKNFVRSMFSRVVGFRDCKSDVLCCPDFVMEELSLKIGSVISVIEVTPSESLLAKTDHYTDCKIDKFEKPVFPKQINKIYENVIQTVVDNMSCNKKINTLITGSTGTGKTFILNSLAKYFKKVFLHCLRIDCKVSSKSKLSGLSKMFSEKLSECCKYQPSVLLIDDLDVLMIDAEEGNHYTRVYRGCVGNLIISLLSSYQNIHDINVIATGSCLSKFKPISTDHGPLIFHNICEIMELEPEERSFMLKNLIRQRYPRYTFDENVADNLSNKMKSYNIQDICDLVNIVVFKCHSKMGADKTNLTETDFEYALSEKVPLSLYGVDLHKNPIIKWEDIGGMEETKAMLKEIFSWPLKYQEVYKSCPLRLQCGVLLYGAPGTGKTLIASAVASECGLNLISIKGPEIFSKYVGASEQGIRDLFVRARKANPCLLFFDEFDSLASRRGSSNQDVNDRVVNQLLTELDGVEELTGVYILGATSRPDLLDPALIRPGRLDKTVHCKLPNQDERLSILKALSKRLKSAEDLDLEIIASKTEGYTGADLQAVLYAAQSAMVKEAEKDHNGSHRELILRQSHLLSGLADTRPSLSEEDKLKFEMIYDSFISSRTGGAFDQSGEMLNMTMFA